MGIGRASSRVFRAAANRRGYAFLTPYRWNSERKLLLTPRASSTSFDLSRHHHKPRVGLISSLNVPTLGTLTTSCCTSSSSWFIGSISRPFSQQVDVDDSADDDENMFEADDVEAADDSYKILWNRLDPDKYLNIVSAVKEWQAAGYSFTRATSARIIVRLKCRKRNLQAMELLSWVVETKPFEPADTDYAQLVTFACRNRKFLKAKIVFDNLPAHVDKWTVFSALVAGCASKNMVVVSERIMKDRPPLAQPYNSMILMYIRVGMASKIPGVYKDMKAAGVEPNVMTYTLLLKYKDRFGEIEGLKEEAEAALEMVDLDKVGSKYTVAGNMMFTYALLGKPAHVESIWSIMDQERWLPKGVYIMAIESFALLGEIRKAEKVAKIKEIPEIHDRLYQAMARHYSKQGQMEKAEQTLVKAAEMRIPPTFSIYNHLVSGYLARNEPDKAVKKLKEAFETVKDELSVPTYSTVMSMLPVYAERKDVESAEQLVERYKGWRDAKLYNELLKVYLSAQKPVAGLNSRMKLKGVLPDKTTKQLMKKLSVISSE